MSECPSIMKRAIGALAGVAVDAVRDVTVSQLDELAHKLHQHLPNLRTTSNIPNPSDSAENGESATDENTAGSASIPSAILTGAFIGIGVALLISIKR